MDPRLELEGYEAQIKEIDESLRLDPSNVELTELKTELETLVDLLRKSLGPAASTSNAPAASTSRSAAAPAGTGGNSAAGPSAQQPLKTFAAGADVMARWAKDKQFYPARITSVSGAAHDPVYTVIFDIDKTTEVVRSGDVKARKENSYAQGKKRGYGETQEPGGSSSTPSGSGERDGKKGVNKTEKKAVKEDERKARVAAQNKAQSTWQSFAKKGAKKGISIPGVTGNSQFRSPDNPYGKVGVVGSGKGMTSYEQKKRTKFDEGALGDE